MLLIGPKGSGKSYIGALIDRVFGIPFIRVEDWAKVVKRDRHVDDEGYLREVFGVIEAGIRERLAVHGQLVFESTGLTPYFDAMLANLQRDFPVITIRIEADPDTCLARVKHRDQSLHIDVSDAHVQMINEQVLARDLPTDHRIINTGKDEPQLVAALSAILGPHLPGQQGG